MDGLIELPRADLLQRRIMLLGELDVPRRHRLLRHHLRPSSDQNTIRGGRKDVTNSEAKATRRTRSRVLGDQISRNRRERIQIGSEETRTAMRSGKGGEVVQTPTGWDVQCTEMKREDKLRRRRFGSFISLHENPWKFHARYAGEGESSFWS
ncbi:hypothetical protein B296_00023827 [Ensete ventricosum]|uniref:Uncharacterized protein n=1 Tax=Ensete ventricosum TaxID=4639 RepID=A0A426YS85_ENSVE|nr:hypothetical protein B296_00023827 [Ensete ventricosum]